DRQPWLDENLRPRLFAYLGGMIRDENGIALIINGMPDHVHILAKLKQDRAISDVLRTIKACSSGWIHREFPELQQFAWQTGYGAFTVSQSQVPTVTSYIRNQEEHHRNETFQGEFRRFLIKHGVEFTEEELWD